MADQPTLTQLPALSDTIAKLAGASAGNNDDRGTLTGLDPGATFIDTQKRIAFALLLIMIGVIAIITVVALGYSVRCSIDGGSCDRSSKALDLLNGSMSPIFTAMIGLVGSVVGFYFGSRQS